MLHQMMVELGSPFLLPKTSWANLLHCLSTILKHPFEDQLRLVLPDKLAVQLLVQQLYLEY